MSGLLVQKLAEIPAAVDNVPVFGTSDRRERWRLGRYSNRNNNMISANLYRGIPAPLPEELIETLVQSAYVRIERIVSWQQATAPDTWYDQQWSEWVILLQGEAGLRMENQETQTLNPGDYLLIPAGCRHRVEWTTSNPPAIWLAVHFGEA